MRPGAVLQRLQHQWLVGFAVLLVVGASSLVFGLAAVILLGGAFWLLGLNMSPAGEQGWFIASALVWLPLAAGAVEKGLRGLLEPEH